MSATDKLPVDQINDHFAKQTMADCWVDRQFVGFT